MNAEILRWTLLVFFAVMYAIALAYLLRRRLSFFELLGWGLLALAVPVFGPFFTIAARPGQRGRERAHWIRRRRLQN